MKTALSTIGALLLGSAAIAQNGDISVVHGIPGLAGPVDVVANGSTVFSGVTFGSSQSAQVAPGTYAIDIVQGGAVLLSSSATIAADESYTAAAYLQQGGNPTISVFQNDLSAVRVQGDCRITFRHLADASLLFLGAESSNTQALTFLTNGQEIPLELEANTFVCRAAEYTGGPNFPFPFPASAASTGNQSVALDEGLIVNFVGVPGSPSFVAITERVALEPASIVIPLVCDLTVAGTLVGGSLSTGGTLDWTLTNARPGDPVIVFLAFDNTPTTVLNINLGIGGTGLFPVAFGVADNMGNFSLTQNVPPSGTIGLPTPIVLDLWAQGVSLDQGFNPNATCLSDVESFQVSFQ